MEKIFDDGTWLAERERLKERDKEIWKGRRPGKLFISGKEVLPNSPEQEANTMSHWQGMKQVEEYDRLHPVMR